jgi:hypothetical protein
MSAAGTNAPVPPFLSAMFEALPEHDPDIASHEVSEDGVAWRPFEPERDVGRTLHRRIKFAPVGKEHGVSQP